MAIALRTFVILLVIAAAHPKSCPGQVKTGLKAGLNYSNLHADDALSHDRKATFHAGFFFRIPLGLKLQLQPELLWMQKGTVLTYDQPEVKGSAKYTMNYVEVPVLFVLQPLPVFNFHFGPYISYLGSVNVRNDEGDRNFDFETLSRRDFRDFDLGIAVGAGIDLGKIHAGVRYNYGFFEIGRPAEINGTSFAVGNGNYSITSVYLGYSFVK